METFCLDLGLISFQFRTMRAMILLYDFASVRLEHCEFGLGFRFWFVEEAEHVSFHHEPHTAGHSEQYRQSWRRTPEGGGPARAPQAVPGVARLTRPGSEAPQASGCRW